MFDTPRQYKKEDDINCHMLGEQINCLGSSHDVH